MRRGRRKAGWLGWLLATGVSVVPVAEAQGPSRGPTGEPEVPRVIERLQAQGAEVVALGEASGVSGFLVHRDGGGAYSAYVTPGGGLLVGLLIGPEGEDLTGRQVQRAGEAGELEGLVTEETEEQPQVAVASGDPVEALLEATERAYGFTLGEAGPVIHVFADRTCPYSYRHVEGLKALARAGRVRAHVIPIGLLGEQAALRAVEIAGSQRPEVAWEGTVLPEWDQELGAARVQRNMALHAAWKVRGVPFSVWRGPQGVRVFYGAGDASAFASDVVPG